MKRFCAIAAIIILGATANAGATWEDFIPALRATGNVGSPRPALYPPGRGEHGPGRCGKGVRLVTPVVRAGYERLRFQANFPFTPVPVSAIFPLEVTADANLAVGSVGGLARVTRRLSLFANAEANASGDFNVITPAEPSFAGTEQVTWDGTGFEKIKFMGGLELLLSDYLPVWNRISVIGGFSYDRFGMRLTSPQDEPNLLPATTLSYSGEVDSRLYMPFLGGRLDFRRITGSFLLSPYVFNDSECLLRSVVQFPAAPVINSRFRYILDGPGVFVEGGLQCTLNPWPSLLFAAWSKVNYLEIRGIGTVEPEIQGAPLMEVSADEDSSLNRTLFSVGMALGLSF